MCFLSHFLDLLSASTSLSLLGVRKGQRQREVWFNDLPVRQCLQFGSALRETTVSPFPESKKTGSPCCRTRSPLPNGHTGGLGTRWHWMRRTKPSTPPPAACASSTRPGPSRVRARGSRGEPGRLVKQGGEGWKVFFLHYLLHLQMNGDTFFHSSPLGCPKMWELDEDPHALMILGLGLRDWHLGHGPQFSSPSPNGHDS